jgi:hypothetical protein
MEPEAPPAPASEEEAPVQEPVQLPAPSRGMRVVTEQAYPRGMNFKYVRPKLEAEMSGELFKLLNNGLVWRVWIDRHITKGDMANEPGIERFELSATIEIMEG